MTVEHQKNLLKARYRSSRGELERGVASFPRPTRQFQEETFGGQPRDLLHSLQTKDLLDLFGRKDGPYPITPALNGIHIWFTDKTGRGPQPERLSHPRREPLLALGASARVRVCSLSMRLAACYPTHPTYRRHSIQPREGPTVSEGSMQGTDLPADP